MKFRTKIATPNDTIALWAFLEKYLSESDLVNHLTYSPENSFVLLNMIAEEEEACGVIIFADNVICGYAAFSHHTGWFKEKEAYIEMFYIHPEMRGTGASRILLDACIKELEKNNVRSVVTSCESGFGEKNDKLYRNLFLKKGFKVLGTAVRKFM